MTILGLDVYVWLILLGGVLAVLGFLWRFAILPAVVTALEGRVNARLDELHNESLTRIGNLEERFTNSEGRYDDGLNDIRGRLDRAKV